MCFCLAFDLLIAGVWTARLVFGCRSNADRRLRQKEKKRSLFRCKTCDQLQFPLASSSAHKDRERLAMPIALLAVIDQDF